MGAITDALAGRTVTEVRRNPDGSINIQTDTASSVTLAVDPMTDRAVPVMRKFVGASQEIAASLRDQPMRLGEAFQGFVIDYVYYDGPDLVFVCARKRHDRIPNEKQHGWRGIRLKTSDGQIQDIPEVSATVMLCGLQSVGIGRI